MIEIKNENVFMAYQGGYWGPSFYYFVNKKNNSYEFRFGYSPDGRRIENNASEINLNTFEKDGEYYQKFINEILVEIKNWNESYSDNNIMDGTQWNIQLIEYNKKYSGSNDFPQNYKNVVKILIKYFNVELFIKEKYKEL